MKLFVAGTIAVLGLMAIPWNGHRRSNRPRDPRGHAQESRRVRSWRRSPGRTSAVRGGQGRRQDHRAVLRKHRRRVNQPGEPDVITATKTTTSLQDLPEQHQARQLTIIATIAGFEGN